MKRVGFIIADGSDGWLGGINYRRNLFAAITANPDRRIEPVLIVTPSMPDAQLAGFPAMEVRRDPLADFQHPGRRIGQITRRLLDRDLVLERMMARHRIDLLSHSVAIGRRSSRPAISWIPDLQHVRMPHFFPAEERAMRDANYRRLIDGSRLVMVSSADARGDLVRFAPDAEAKVRVLHFVSGFDTVAAPAPRAAIEARFGISRPYFHLPNQFWAHKNHAVVVEALGILKRRGLDVVVLATGKTEDGRNSGHFAELMARVDALGVADRFRPLGVISLAELQGLMLGAVALINPSSFEGWSTTVEESKSLGLPIILSDIPVHVEQSPPLGRYFAAGSAAALADAMAAVWQGHDPGAAVPARAAAAAAMPGRVRAFGRRFEQIALEALAG